VSLAGVRLDCAAMLLDRRDGEAEALSARGEALQYAEVQMKSVRKDVKCIALAACVAAHFGMTICPASSQSADNSVHRMTSEVLADRLNQLAQYLDSQSGEASQLQATVQSSSSHRDLVAAVGPLASIGEKIKSIIPDTGGSPAGRLNRDLLAKDEASSAFEQHANSYSTYAQYLRQLSATVKNAPVDQAIVLVNNTFVPKDVVAVVINPGGLNRRRSFQPPPHLRNVRTQVASVGDLIIGLNPETTVEYPAISELVVDLSNTGDGNGGRTALCTATLIAPQVVLSAAHCFCDLRWAQGSLSRNADNCKKATYKRGLDDIQALDPHFFSIYFQHAGSVAVTDIRISDDYNFPAADLAVARLARPLTNIAPLSLNSKTPIGPRTEGYIVGFGEHSALNANGAPVSSTRVAYSEGIKLWGTVTTDTCTGDYSGKGLICWLGIKNGSQTIRASTCHGDSGGPLITGSPDNWVLAGVTSGTTSDNCFVGQSFDVDVFANAARIDAMIKALSAPTEAAAATATTPCFALGSSAAPKSVPAAFPFFDANRLAYRRAYYSFGETKSEFAETFDLQTNWSLLRVSVNSTRPTLQTHLAVEITMPGEKAPSYKLEGETPALSCSIPNPAVGTWSFNIKGTSPQEIQVIGTVE
jgi:hypothetical protein